ncbi:GNAT family N-acetyltransferase [Thalassospira sp.]|uniref:GNAT family N-acetyltransferase n=1 Tax=Thalassospira sp. TaxID=1912094 RepID=UPI002732CAF3|nr:N-acetyltransferase [Thalassospira sp.]MDP2699327.1 N-acetyltransferase [Thalassospira sp.]
MTVPESALPLSIIPLTPAFAGVAALLHAGGFDDPWPEDDIIALLAVPGAFGLLAFDQGGDGADRPLGFVLIQAVMDEAEINTLITAPFARRRGVAQALLAAVTERLRDGSVNRLLLEVAEDNSAAIALYRSCGFEETGRRKEYYRRKTGRRVDALVMERKLGVCALGWGD